MKVLVVDSGGRGHAIAWHFKNDPHVKEVIRTPGNAGIAREIRCENARENEEIMELAKREKAAPAFMGPESPLTNGVVNLLTSEGILVIGPTKRASILVIPPGMEKDMPFQALKRLRKKIARYFLPVSTIQKKRRW